METHLVVSKAGDITRAYDTNIPAEELREMEDVCYNVNDVSAAIASGSLSPHSKEILLPAKKIL